MKKGKTKDEVAQFKIWLAARGGEVLVTTNEWEVVRFRGDGVTSIIYVNKIGARSFSGRARAAWDAFKSGDNTFRITTKAVGLSQRQRKKAPLIRTLIERDGNLCFYCGGRFTDDKPPTKEHLVAVTAGGPDHTSNLFLACYGCNTEAGHLSAPEKIRLRDRKRRGRGSALLHRVLDCDAIDPTLAGADVAIIDDIQSFLHPVPTAKGEPDAAP